MSDILDIPIRISAFVILDSDNSMLIPGSRATGTVRFIVYDKKYIHYYINIFLNFVLFIYIYAYTSINLLDINVHTAKYGEVHCDVNGDAVANGL